MFLLEEGQKNPTILEETGYVAEEILQELLANYPDLLALVCGEEKLYESEYAVLNSEKIKQSFENNKTSITISRVKGEKAFRTSVGGGRSKSIKISTNRLTA